VRCVAVINKTARGSNKPGALNLSYQAMGDGPLFAAGERPLLPVKQIPIGKNKRSLLIFQYLLKHCLSSMLV
jgi:hypothetical protein